MPSWLDMAINIAEELILAKSAAEKIAQYPHPVIRELATALALMSNEASGGQAAGVSETGEPIGPQLPVAAPPPLPGGPQLGVVARIGSRGSHQSGRVTNGTRAAQQQDARRSHSVLSDHWVANGAIPADAR